MDKLPEDWNPDGLFVDGVRCKLLTCETFADADSCSMDFSVPPLSRCVTTTTGLLGDYCRLSCRDCGKLDYDVLDKMQWL